MNNCLPRPESLIEHRGSMLLIDELVSVADRTAHCVGYVRRDNPFLMDGHLPAWALLEYIAQAVATLAGYLRLTAGDQYLHGLLLGCRRMEFEDVLPSVEDRLDLHVEEILQLDKLGNFKGCAWLAGRKIASGVLSVYETEYWPDSVEHAASTGQA
ncbi:MAG: hypothetical protein DHS20C01_24880 [marine bacterium B5-7]|nr:MAG: hypothetical protein DHS20C01_24880 [marine bacterium B5-7]